jgi:hypothetical protein
MEKAGILVTTKCNNPLTPVTLQLSKDQVIRMLCQDQCASCTLLGERWYLNKFTVLKEMPGKYTMSMLAESENFQECPQLSTE